MHHETQFHHASNWTVYALQTEEENPAGADSFAIEMQDAHNLTFANLFMYRVSRNVKPKLNAVESTGSAGIHFENVHNFSMTRLAYDNSVFDSTSGVRVRSHDFTSFELTGTTKLAPPLPLPPGIFAANARLESIATGFSNASGLTANDSGQLFFTDAAMHQVFRWNSETSQAELLTDKISSPMAVASIGTHTLLAIDLSKTIYSIDTQTGATDKVPSAAAPPANVSLLLPIGFHNSIETLVRQMERRGVVYAPRSNMAIVANVTDEPRSFFHLPSSSVAIMAGGNWQPMLQASQWGLVGVGGERLAGSEEDDATYRVKLENLKSLTFSEFTPRGASGVVTDSAGNVYLAADQLYIYNAAGKQVGMIEIPERPSSLAFGGSDHRTLFIGARGSLFSIRSAARGN